MTPDRARILVLTYTPFAQEPRALKQVRYLKDSHDVTTAGFGPAPFAEIPHVELPELSGARWGLLGRLLNAGLMVLRWYRQLARLSVLDRHTVSVLAEPKWDIVIAHDLKALDASLALAPAAGVILDLHEYAPRQEEHSWQWRLLVAPYYRWMCRKRVPLAAAVVTVGQGIADEYKRVFGFDSTVVVNATPYFDANVSPVGSPIRLVHSGGVAVQRRLDLMIRGVRETTADVTLDLFLVGGDPAVREELAELAGDDARITFRDPVPYDQLVPTLSQYDVGLSIFPPTTFNLAWCLPNKFFDFVQARLGVIVGPSPEMARVVDEYGIGMVLPDFEPTSLAQALAALDAGAIEKWKAASAAHAQALSSEPQKGVWEQLVASVVSKVATKA
jgi:hypothetical protein